MGDKHFFEDRWTFAPRRLQTEFLCFVCDDLTAGDLNAAVAAPPQVLHQPRGVSSAAAASAVQDRSV